MIKPYNAKRDERNDVCVAGCALLKDARAGVAQLDTVIQATYLIEEYCPIDRIDLLIQRYQLKDTAECLSANYRNAKN